MDALAQEPREHTLTELSKALGWPKIAVHGLLFHSGAVSLREQSEETGRYKLGIRFFELGVRVSRMWDIRSTAMPHMQHLNYAFGEMVQLGTEDRGQVLYLEKLDSSLLISQTVSLHF